MFKKLLLISSLCLSFALALAQQPQTSDLPPLTPPYPVNASYVNGVAPGYKPSGASTGLNLTLGPGTAYCGSIIPYSGGTLALTNNTTNYVYLDMNNSCTPTVSTSVYTGTQIPLATVVTSGGNITTITDVRTPFVKPQLGSTQQTNGVPNSSQTTLNLAQGTNVSLSNSNGTTTINATQQIAIKHNGSSVSNQGVLDFDDTTPAAPSGSIPVTFQSNSSGKVSGYATVNVGNSLQSQTNLPTSNQSVTIYPTAVSSSFACGTSSGSTGNTSATLNYVYGGSGACAITVTWSGFALPSYVIAGNVTNVYGITVSSLTPQVNSNFGSGTISCGSGPTNLVNDDQWGMSSFNASVSGATGSNIGTITCTASINGSVIGAKTTSMNVALIGLVIVYTGTAPPANTNVQVASPLYYNPITNVLGISSNQGFITLSSGTKAVSTVAACTPSMTCVYRVTNCGQNGSTAIGTLAVTGASVGSSFTITSLSSTNTTVTGDTSFVCWKLN